MYILQCSLRGFWIVAVVGCCASKWLPLEEKNERIVIKLIIRIVIFTVEQKNRHAEA